MKDRSVCQKSNRIFLISLFVLLPVFITGQSSLIQKKRDKTRLLFYNVENLFDTINGPAADEEFLPEGPRKWNAYKYNAKLRNIFKVLVLAGAEAGPPEIIGLCEVENARVVHDLLENTLLSRHNYVSIVAETKDERGIRTALIVDNDNFLLIDHKTYFPEFSDGTYLSTRGVLYVALAAGTDTLNIIVTHWPSRRGGIEETKPLRMMVAKLISGIHDSIGIDKNLIIMGDLNTEPDSDPLIRGLDARPEKESHLSGKLVNVSFNHSSEGSYKYQSNWYTYDQILISCSLMDYSPEFRIIDNEALLMEDSANKGYRPYSTWYGYRYLGGYSDHLPVMLTLEHSRE